jgi:hypothetical protein
LKQSKPRRKKNHPSLKKQNEALEKDMIRRRVAAPLEHRRIFSVSAHRHLFLRAVVFRGTGFPDPAKPSAAALPTSSPLRNG